MNNRRTIYFPENDCRVVTGLANSGEFVAHLEDNDVVRGHGHSVMAAIADLNAKLAAADALPEDYRTPLSGEDLAKWQADRARAIAMAE
jgi:hypothetical protein